MPDQNEQVKKKPSREMVCNPGGSPDAPGLLVRLVGAGVPGGGSRAVTVRGMGHLI